MQHNMLRYTYKPWVYSMLCCIPKHDIFAVPLGLPPHIQNYSAFKNKFELFSHHIAVSEEADVPTTEKTVLTFDSIDSDRLRLVTLRDSIEMLSIRYLTGGVVQYILDEQDARKCSIPIHGIFPQTGPAINSRHSLPR